MKPAKTIMSTNLIMDRNCIARSTQRGLSDVAIAKVPSIRRDLSLLSLFPLLLLISEGT